MTCSKHQVLGLQQLLAASAMIVSLEKIAAAGVLPEAEEQKIRVLIIQACRAFEIPSIAERPAPHLVEPHLVEPLLVEVARAPA